MSRTCCNLPTRLAFECIEEEFAETGKRRFFGYMFCEHHLLKFPVPYLTRWRMLGDLKRRGENWGGERKKKTGIVHRYRYVRTYVRKHWSVNSRFNKTSQNLLSTVYLSSILVRETRGFRVTSSNPGRTIRLDVYGYRWIFQFRSAVFGNLSAIAITSL